MFATVKRIASAASKSSSPLLRVRPTVAAVHSTSSAIFCKTKKQHDEWDFSCSCDRCKMGARGSASIMKRCFATASDSSLPDALPISGLQFVKGDPITLEEGNGKNVFVVEFWATWCPPCRASIPHLTKLQQQYKDKDVVFLGITTEDDAEKVKRFVNSMGDKMDYRVAIDTEGSAQANYMERFGVNGIPHAFLINKQGKVAWAGHPMQPEFEHYINKFASEPGTQQQQQAKVNFTLDQLASMSTKDLQQILKDRHISTADCVEKKDLIAKVQQHCM